MSHGKIGTNPSGCSYRNEPQLIASDRSASMRAQPDRTASASFWSLWSSSVSLSLRSVAEVCDPYSAQTNQWF